MILAAFRGELRVGNHRNELRRKLSPDTRGLSRAVTLVNRNGYPSARIGRFSSQTDLEQDGFHPFLSVSVRICVEKGTALLYIERPTIWTAKHGRNGNIAVLRVTALDKYQLRTSGHFRENGQHSGDTQNWGFCL